MNKRALALGGATVFVVLLVVLAIVFKPQPTPVPLSSSVVYTDAITGLNGTDIVQQTGDLDPSGVNQATVTVDGIDALYNAMTTDQASSVQDTLNNFLMAHSGLQTVQAGIKNDTINTPDQNDLSFVVVTTTPQVSYEVSVHINNQYQTIPDVTIVEEQ